MTAVAYPHMDAMLNFVRLRLADDQRALDMRRAAIPHGPEADVNRLMWEGITWNSTGEWPMRRVTELSRPNATCRRS